MMLKFSGHTMGVPGMDLFEAMRFFSELGYEGIEVKLVPTNVFLTKGVGVHPEKLASFEMALRDAQVARFNLVRVSSIFPPGAKIISRRKGLAMLQPGEIVHAVISENATNEPYLSRQKAEEYATTPATDR